MMPEPERRGRFVDEFWTEDDEEAERLEDAAALRASRMLGCVFAVGMLILLLLLAWAAWSLLHPAKVI